VSRGVGGFAFGAITGAILATVLGGCALSAIRPADIPLDGPLKKQVPLAAFALWVVVGTVVGGIIGRTRE
jgi:hypothetical protein